MNLSFLMLGQIKEATKRSRACLPYGMVFTLIFIKFGVSLDGEDAKRLLHIDHYNQRSLQRMGYINVDDKWVCRSMC